MWKEPYRPANEITQGFNDGLVTVYTVTNVSKPGYKPVEGLSAKISLRYAEQRLGIQRYYSGLQNQIQVERVLRVPRHGDVNSQDVAITEDGRQYRIDLIQQADGVYPPALDLTLVRIDQEYEVLS